MELYYGQTKSRFAEGKKFRNARNFREPEKEATKVFVVGPFPKIVAAYKNLGIEAIAMADGDPRLDYPDGQYVAPAGFNYSSVASNSFAADQSVAEIPDGWESMPWADLRRLAASVSQGAPIVSREDAETAIRAALERRGPHVEQEA